MHGRDHDQINVVTIEQLVEQSEQQMPPDPRASAARVSSTSKQARGSCRPGSAMRTLSPIRPQPTMPTPIIMRARCVASRKSRRRCGGVETLTRIRSDAGSDPERPAVPIGRSEAPGQPAPHRWPGTSAVRRSGGSRPPRGRATGGVQLPRPPPPPRPRCTSAMNVVGTGPGATALIVTPGGSSAANASVNAMTAPLTRRRR